MTWRELEKVKIWPCEGFSQAANISSLGGNLSCPNMKDILNELFAFPPNQHRAVKYCAQCPINHYIATLIRLDSYISFSVLLLCVVALSLTHSLSYSVRCWNLFLLGPFYSEYDVDPVRCNSFTWFSTSLHFLWCIISWLGVLLTVTGYSYELWGTLDFWQPIRDKTATLSFMCHSHDRVFWWCC